MPLRTPAFALAQIAFHYGYEPLVLLGLLYERQLLS